MKQINRFWNVAVPGIAIPTCIGSVYCWSQFAAALATTFGISIFATNIGFTLIIFFLGVFAALFGRTIENNPKIGAILSTIIFVSGFLLLGLSVYTGCLPLFYVATAAIGAGTGIGYVTPIKTLMAYFADHKGLASGLAITGFGLAKFIASPAIAFLLTAVPLYQVFIILGLIYAVIMTVSTILLKKYDFGYEIKTPFKYGDILKSKEWWAIWFMFMVNISCGLSIIAQEAALLGILGIPFIAGILAMTALANSGGRLGFSSLSDKIGRKASYHFVCSFGMLGALFCITGNPVMAVIGIFLCEAAYGGNFSCLPSLLAKRFGITNASKVHAMTLTGWSIGGIFGPLLAATFVGTNLYIVLAILYFIAFTVMEIFVHK